MRRLTTASIVALLAGIGLGALAGPELPATSLELLDWVVRAWTAAFSVVVLPLVVFLLFAVVAESGLGAASGRRLGLYTAVAFGALLTLTTILTVILTWGALALPGLRSLSLRAASVAPAPIERTVESGPWLEMLSPARLVSAALSGDLLSLMLLTFLAALIARRVSPESRALLISLSRALSEVTIKAAQALIALAPVIVFAVALDATRSPGNGVGTVLFAFVTMKCAACLIVTIALYPVATLFGGVSIGRFARAIAPAQLIALTSRSSLATLPSLVEGARNVLGLPPHVSDVVLPVAGATLKLSRAFTNPVKLLFLVHVLGLTVTPSQLVIFIMTILLLSPATVGIPHLVSTGKTLPAFAAAGVPVEYVLLLGLTTVVTDAFGTLLNSTGYMSAAVLVSRWALRTAPATAELPGLASGLAAPGAPVTDSYPC